MALTDGLIFYLSCEEASGNAVDATGNRTFVETGGTIGSATGKVGNARDFEAGDTEWFACADTGAGDPLRVGNGDLTVVMWINPESISNYPLLFRKATGTGQNAYACYIDTGSGVNRLTFITLDNTFVQIPTATTTGAWTMVAVKHDGATNEVIGISINGSAWIETAYASGIDASATGDFELGAQSNGGLYFDGLMDEVAAWSRVLSGVELAQLYNDGDGLPYPLNTPGRNTRLVNGNPVHC